MTIAIAVHGKREYDLVFHRKAQASPAPHFGEFQRRHWNQSGRRQAGVVDGQGVGVLLTRERLGPVGTAIVKGATGMKKADSIEFSRFGVGSTFRRVRAG